MIKIYLFLDWVVRIGSQSGVSIVCAEYAVHIYREISKIICQSYDVLFAPLPAFDLACTNLTLVSLFYGFVRIWIISHGTPHAAAGFRRTPGKILLLFSSTCT